MRAAEHKFRHLAGVAVVLLLVLLTASCGDKKSDTNSNSNSNSKVGEKITVFAAASLTEPFTTLGKRFEAEQPGARVTFNFGASSELVQQVGQGAPADVLATADTDTMDRAVRAGDATAPHVFAGNRMAILVRRGNPRGIKQVADLAKPGVVFVLCAAEVPCGKLGAKVLRMAGVDAKPKSYEDNAKGVVSRVALGEADAGLGYVSDARGASGKVQRVDIPTGQNVTTRYPIAVLSESRRRPTARAFVAYIRSRAGQAALRADGFLPPP